MVLDFKNILCPVCDSSNYRILFTDKNRRELFDIETNTVKCRNCGMVYLNPVPDMDQFFGFYETIYTTKRNESDWNQTEHDTALKGHMNAIFKLLYNYINIKYDYDKRIYANIGAGKKIIDIGCGDGAKLRPFVEKGYEVYGVDINPKAIAEAKTNIPGGKFICGTIEHADIPKKIFDYVRVDNVFEHINKPKKFLFDIKELLKPDGKLVVYVPSISTWQFYVFGKFYSQSWIPFHINLFSKSTLRAIAEKTGYSIENMYNLSDAWWVILSFRQLCRWKRKHKVDFKQGGVEYILIILLNYILYIPTKLGNADMLIATMKSEPINKITTDFN